ncbi:SSO2 protein [Sodiomyces alkalinus F11]|uniref:SSO2 protein n=1 Tax=Sodiomyces alkalinus (strain CBS 110278 / VKM F-3762 / F11) TaxID=1314773 RepID=A0A3N2PZH5_SODAK|nr:SSO2 protein [Sodiomyces alkalinus F11]ROT39929.1 SSO2 protein [Sodiomyces alkalinus F11]
MSYGYGAGQNPFDQRDPPPSSGYGGPPSYSAPFGGGNDYGPYGGSNVEMAPLAQNAGRFGQGDPNAILNECRSIDQGIDEVEQNLGQLRMLQDRALADADTSASSSTKRQLDALGSQTMTMYRSLVERVRTVKSNPDAHSAKNSPQVGRVDRRLKQVIQQYQQIEAGFRKKNQDQMARQYRIVRPDADENEVRQAVEDPNGGAVFSQALMQSSRQGRARAALTAVQDRHAEIQRIEQQMVELAQMFQDMDTLVVQQQAAVAQIEAKGEEVAENLDKGNQEISVAVNTARSTRKKKWWCLAICVLILVIIAVVVVVYFVVNNNNNNGGGGGGGNNAKRSIDLAALPIVDTVPVDTGNIMPHIFKDKMVRPGPDWQPGANAARDAAAVRFARRLNRAPLRF